MVQVNSFLDREHAGNGSVMHSQGSGSDCPGTPLGVSHIHVHHADLTLRPQRRTAHPSTQGCPFVATLSRLAMSHLIPVIAMLISTLKYHGWKQTMWALELAVLLSTMPLLHATSPWFGESDSGWPQTNVPPASISLVLGLQAGATFDLTFVPRSLCDFSVINGCK